MGSKGSMSNAVISKAQLVIGTDNVARTPADHIEWAMRRPVTERSATSSISQRVFFEDLKPGEGRIIPR